MKRIFLFFLFSFLLAYEASSSGYLMPDIGGNFASPTDTTPASIYWNPAATAYSNGANIFLDIAPAYQSLNYERVDYNESLEIETIYEKTSFSLIAPAPFLGFTYSFNNIPLTLGLAGYAHMGREPKWDEEGPQRFNGTEMTLIALNAGPSLAYAVSQRFSLGFAFNYIYNLLDAKTSMGLTPGNEDPASELRVHLKNLTASTFSFTVGAMVKPLRTLYVGVAYISPYKVKFKGTGELRPGPSASGIVSALLGEGLAIDAIARQNFPQAINFGVKYRLSRSLESNLVLQWYDWSVNKELSVDISSDEPGMQMILSAFGTQKMNFHFVDTVNWRLDFRYSFNNKSRIGFGAGFDPSGIPSEYVSASNLEFDKLQIFLAGEYIVSDNLSIGGGFNHYQPVTSRHITASNQTYSATGFYRAVIEKLNITLSTRF